MRQLLLIAFAALSFIASPALAEARYAGYEGKDSIIEGRGGTKESDKGIDWWTSGAPPRKFQVLGIITDSRKDKPLSGKAIGSSKIAKMVLQQGGDAVLILDQNSQYSGSLSTSNIFANPGYGSIISSGRAVHQITTKLVVIKYLEK